MPNYDPYGYSTLLIDALIMQYAGERRDPAMGLYLLGNGHRAYSPRLKRFFSPDLLSPFARGGVNAYAYCAGDPINRVDPSGQSWKWLRHIFRSNPKTATSNRQAPPPVQNGLMKKYIEAPHWWSESHTPFSSTETLQTNLSSSTISLASTGANADKSPGPSKVVTPVKSGVSRKQDTSSSRPNTIGFHQSSKAFKKAQERSKVIDIRDPKPAMENSAPST